MKRSVLRFSNLLGQWRVAPALCKLLLLTCVLQCAVAQDRREAYQTAYRTWREVDPMLETSAALGGEEIRQRATRVAAAAARYGAARTAYLNARAEELRENQSRLESASVSPDPAIASGKSEQDFVAAATAAVARSISTFANDPDPGIRPLRAALEREQTALAALNTSIVQRQQAAMAVQEKSAVTESLRGAALDNYRGSIAGLNQIIEHTARETAAWAEYYRQLGDGAQGPLSAGPGPTTISRNASAPPAAASPLGPGPNRYAGSWFFPPVSGLYHGIPPQTADLEVTEQGGQLRGTLSVRFLLPPGTSGDAQVRFDFSGEFKAGRNQTLPLTTSEGAKGVVELIPGPAVNLLEVNFRTDRTPGKIPLGNFILIRK